MANVLVLVRTVLVIAIITVMVTLFCDAFALCFDSLGCKERACALLLVSCLKRMAIATGDIVHVVSQFAIGRCWRQCLLRDFRNTEVSLFCAIAAITWTDGRKRRSTISMRVFVLIAAKVLIAMQRVTIALIVTLVTGMTVVTVALLLLLLLLLIVTIVMVVHISTLVSLLLLLLL